MPLLVVAAKDNVAGYMSALALPNESLPTMIFFNKFGKELARVIAMKPSTTKSSHAQENVI